MHPGISERLEAAGIGMVTETASYLLFTRGECLAFVERTRHMIGSTGLLTTEGIAFLIWREGRPYLKAKGSETAAAPEQVAAMQRFSRDLQAALRPLRL